MPSDIRFSDLRKLLECHGWDLVRTNGSHHVFTGPERRPISIPVHRGKVKDVYRRKVDKAIRELEEESQDDG